MSSEYVSFESIDDNIYGNDDNIDINSIDTLLDIPSYNKEIKSLSSISSISSISSNKISSKLSNKLIPYPISICNKKRSHNVMEMELHLFMIRKNQRKNFIHQLFYKK